MHYLVGSTTDQVVYYQVVWQQVHSETFVDDVLDINQLPVSAEGRVEHQKLNQVAALLSPS